MSGDRELATERAQIVETVSVQRAVADVLPAAQFERFALEGMTRIDELGLPREIVVAFTGVDLEARYAENVTEFETALDTLQGSYRELELEGGQTLGEALARARRSIEMQREQVASRAGASDEIREAFVELDTVLDAALAAQTMGVVRDDVSSSQLQIGLLGDVIESADRYGQSIVAGIVYRTAELRDETLRSLAVHEHDLDRFAQSLDERNREQFGELRAGLVLMDLPPIDPDGANAAERALDPATVQESAVVALGFLDYLQALQEFTADFHDAAASTLEAEAAAARSDANRATVMLLGVGALTMLVAIAVVWSLLVPIRRLTARASDISEGDLDVPPLPLRGPSDIRGMTHTMNQMLTTLHQVDSEIGRLANGSQDPRDGLHLPGGIGVSIRASFERLEAVTDQLQQSQQLSAAIIAEAADAIWTTDVDGVIQSANQASVTLLGIAADEQIGTGIGEFLNQLHGEAKVITPERASRTVLVARSSVQTQDGEIWVVIAHDISERTEFEERLAYQAHHDALTGLPNRFAVLDHLDDELRGDDQLAVLFIDLDGFKAVNDAEGHAAGDRLLTDIAATLLASVRGHEFVGRLGGDEFVVVTRRFSQIADVTALGHRLIREIEQPRLSGDRMFVMSASVGIAIAEPGSSGLDVIQRADSALYQAKRMGRGRVGMFDASMQEQIDSESELEMALRQAVKNDELVMHLQPLVDLQSGAVNGAEALVRWNRDGHGLVPPGSFIPIAERSSLIFEIERWVLHRACELAATWRERDPACAHRVAVNISGRHLIEGDLVADIDAVLSLTGADPTMLELELTETQLLEDLDRATEVLDLLRAKGILIAVDDFGTGYSSMTYLRELPIDAIKIDRSFVERATEHGYDSTVIEALLTIGRTLGLSVVAEGIETDAQLDYVRARGCDRAQGFLLARPMPIEDAEQMLFAGTPMDADSDDRVGTRRPQQLLG